MFDRLMCDVGYMLLLIAAIATVALDDDCYFLSPTVSRQVFTLMQV